MSESRPLTCEDLVGEGRDVRELVGPGVGETLLVDRSGMRRSRSLRRFSTLSIEDFMKDIISETVSEISFDILA